MLANELLEDAFGRVREVVHDTVTGLSDDDLAYRPGKDANSIAWLIWHLSRIQDDHIAEVAGTDQVWTKGWAKRFDLPFDETATGYGQSSSEVAAVRVGSDLLLGYYDTVHEATMAYLGQLRSEAYSEIVDHRFNPPVTLAVRLISVVSDNLQHAGQAAYIKGLRR